MFDSHAATHVRVKICGITSKTDALASIEAGADALGFNLYPQSSRYLDLQRSADWLATLPPSVSKIAVMVNPTLEEALATAGLPFFDCLQLHGHESAGLCLRLAQARVRFAKAIPVAGDRENIDLGNYHTANVVLDSMADGQFGGTGRTFQWTLARRFVDQHPDFRVILAGGLSPQNVAEAIHAVRPFGVDVTTGVERSKGVKDHALVRSFVDAVRASAS